VLCYITMFSGIYNSVKSYMGYDTLEATSGGENEEKVDDKNVEEQKKSLWKQLSGLIGQDVTSLISLPVWVFDPISFLQIMCEPMMYAELLHKASESSDQYHRMGYLCAWIASGYSCAVRLKKPFNPLLGETFEFIPQMEDGDFLQSRSAIILPLEFPMFSMISSSCI